MQINQHAYVFAIATYGGMVGAPFSEIRRILNEKEIELAATFTVNMPGSNLLLMPPASEEEQSKCFKEENVQISTYSFHYKKPPTN